MATKITIKQEDKKKINELINLLRKEGIKVSKVFLFGSYAKGTNRIDSDIDLAVISPQFGKNAIKEMMFLRKLAIKIDSHLEPIPLSSKGLADPYSSFSQEIRKFGILVN